MIALDLLSPTPLNRGDVANRIDEIWTNPLRLGIAQIIEDLVDPKPENRLLVIKYERETGIYAELQKFVSEQVTLYRELGMASVEELTILGLLKRYVKGDVTKAIENIEQIRRVSIAWYNNITKNQLWFSRINAACFYLIVFTFILYTLADIKVALFPDRDIAYIDTKWIQLLTLLPHDFRIGDVQGNFPGRLVAFTFGLIAARYYANIFATLRLAHTNNRTQNLTNALIRINAISYVIPTMIAIVWNPRWWPWCSAVGILFPAFNNLVCWRIVRSAAEQSRGVFSSAIDSTHSRDFVDRYWQWPKQMFFYGALNCSIGALLYAGLAHDEGWYGYIIAAINYFNIYRTNCGSDAPKTLGQLSKFFFVARRLAARGSQPLPPR